MTTGRADWTALTMQRLPVITQRYSSLPAWAQIGVARAGGALVRDESIPKDELWTYSNDQLVMRTRGLTDDAEPKPGLWSRLMKWLGR